MYIQKKLKDLERQRDNIEYEINDIEYEQNNEKIKLHSDVQMYEGTLLKESEIGKLQAEIKEREKKVSLIDKMIRQKTEEYREKLEEERKSVFSAFEQQIDEKRKAIKSLKFNAKIRIGELVEEIEELTGNKYSPRLTYLKGDICSVCRMMGIKETDIKQGFESLYKNEYDLSFYVKIGPYSFPAQVKIDDETFNGKKIYECLKRVGMLESYRIGSSLSFIGSDIKYVYVNIDEKTFNEIYHNETLHGKKYVLSCAISNIVENKDRLENSERYWNKD